MLYFDGLNYHTPYQDIKVSRNVICGIYPFAADINRYTFFKPIFTIGDKKNLYRIEDGVIHAFRSHLIAIFRAYRKYVVFKCIIPKGTQYAIGTDGDICAREIKFIKKIYS